MSTISIEIYPDTPHQRVINQAVEVLKADGVIIYPTDTIYGMGAKLSSKKAIERIIAIKKFSENKMMTLICDDLKRVSRFAHINTDSFKIMKQSLPGPFTFILPATKEVPKLFFKKRRTVGIRIPKNELCLRLVQELDEPLINTSVPFGENGFLIDPQEMLKELLNKIDLILDSGPMQRTPSTIVDLSGEFPEVLREGAGKIDLFI